MGRKYNYDEPLIIDKEFYSLLMMQNTILEAFNKSIKQTKNLSIDIMDKIEKI